MTTIVQKSLLGLSVLMAIVLVAVLTSKKFTLESRRNALLIEMVANISTDLDKLDSGFDTIVSRTEAAKGQLRRLAALHRDNLMICALLHEKHVKKEQITEKTDQYDIEERKFGLEPGSKNSDFASYNRQKSTQELFNNNFYDKRVAQTLDLGEEGLAPLEIRFLHDPTATEGFVECAVMANIYHFFKTSSDKWDAEKVIDVPSKKVEGWGSPEMQGRRLYGAPQMLQLSLDGRRLYVTTSIFSPWDKQFYPEQVKNGSTMVKLDIDVENGGMTLDNEFLIDFGADRDEILLAHEMRYPGGVCTSDISLPEK